jgi:hypothetical protein
MTPNLKLAFSTSQQLHVADRTHLIKMICKLREDVSDFIINVIRAIAIDLVG